MADARCVSLALFAILIPTTIYVEAWALHPLSIIAAAAVLTTLYFNLRALRRLQWSVVPLLFDEAEESPIESILLTLE